MVKIFLDANILVDILEKRKNTSFSQFNECEIHASTLSAHILFYVGRKKVPSNLISGMFLDINMINFSGELTHKAFMGPTTDFEDNIQLHSAAELECDFFITEDRDLLDMKFFGKAKIVSSEEFSSG